MNQPETTSFTPIEESDIDTSLPARFEDQVRKYPDKIAIKEETHSITYSELNAGANRVAHTILANNGDSEKPIVVLAGYGSRTIIALMGVLKAGNPFIIVDPSNPQERIKEILEDSQTHIIVADNENYNFALLFENPNGLKSVYQIININKIDSNSPSNNPGKNISPDQVGFIFYTSGSTGKPKGVYNNHRNILYGISISTRFYMNSADDRHLLSTPLSFGASAGSVFGALLNGGTVLPFSLKTHNFVGLTQWLIQEEITSCFFIPTTFRHFVKSLTEEDKFPHLRIIRLGGEAIYKNDVDLYKKHFADDCILGVGLSSTDAGGICSNIIDKNTEIPNDIVPVGKPREGIEVLLLDDDHNPVGPNEIGEIAVRGRYLPLGYWRRPDLNKEKYLPDPDGGDRRICLTGDIGRFLPDGTLEHISRKDTMVKIRGLRIEIKEIEATLLGSDLVKDTAVLAQDDRFNEKRLVAYVVRSDDTQPSIIDLREAIAEKLPDYMVPSTFVFLDSLPKTNSGKIDRLALPEPPKGRLISGQEYIAPGNETENKLVRIFEKCLDVQPVGIKDDFFELGGHSLVAIQIITEIEEKLHKSIPMNDFTEALTVEKLTEIIDTPETPSSFRYLVGVHTSGTKPPLFVVSPSAVTAMHIEKFTKHLDEDQPLYGFEYAGMDGKSEPFSTIPGLAQAYVQEIQLLQPEGPYYLGGICFGGIVAYEIAQQLLAGGRKVAFLGVFDSNFYPMKRNPYLYYWVMTKQFIANLRGKELNIIVPSLDMMLKRFASDDILKARFKNVYTVNFLARLKYSSPIYPGLITKFTTDSLHARLSTRGWSKATSMDLDLQPISGSHGRIDEERSGFLSEPNLPIVMGKLEVCLEKARKNANSS